MAAVIAGTSMVFAQRLWVGAGGPRRTPPKWAARESFDGSFNYCRGYYTSDHREQGGTGWDTDFPGADNNFSVRLAELTMVNVKLDETGQPDNVVVRLTDPLLYHCPVLFMEDVGTIHSPRKKSSICARSFSRVGFCDRVTTSGIACLDSVGARDRPVLPPDQYPISQHPGRALDRAQRL